MKKIPALAIFLLCLTGYCFSQTVYPTHWWTGMKNNKLQLMIHSDKNIAVDKLVFRSSSPDVKVIKVNKVENRHYLFVDLEIARSAKPQTVKFSFGGIIANEWSNFNYELKARSSENGKTRIKGVTAADFVYLLIPDRFANGDPSNDVIPSYREQANDRSNKFTRHGGDFKGITDHLDHFNNLGVTTIWMTPVIENNTSLMHEWGNSIAGYHGYWFTNHYEVDKRFGGNEGYKKFCDELHRNGMKVIQDAVYNHVSKENWFVLDPPMKDWINNWPSLTTPNHREEVLFDPYASAHDKKIMLDGWFTDHLPDLNQRNPYVANFLIQHAIWTTEEYGIDGWRVDTYKYCDEKFLNDVNVALQREFPAVTVFGEAWVNTIVGNAYFTNNTIGSPFKHNAKGVIDFQTCFAILAGMNEKFGWTNGVNKIYMTMSQDVVYKEPMNNCIFMDNHDMDGVFSIVDEDWTRLRMGINWLLTLRGIPQLYYGTEVLMKNKKTTTDAMVREDFPGGWKGDATNKFTTAGRTDKENEAFNYTAALGRFRKSSSAVTTGKTMQYIPKDGVYIYFRYDAKQSVMVITNTGEKTIKPDWNVYSERVKGFTQLKEVTSGKTQSLEGFEIKPTESFVFELMK
jgi:glycosidase